MRLKNTTISVFALALFATKGYAAIFGSKQLQIDFTDVDDVTNKIT